MDLELGQMKILLLVYPKFHLFLVGRMTEYEYSGLDILKKERVVIRMILPMCSLVSLISMSSVDARGEVSIVGGIELDPKRSYVAIVRMTR